MTEFPLGAFLGAVPYTLLAVAVVLGTTFVVAVRQLDVWIRLDHQTVIGSNGEAHLE